MNISRTQISAASLAVLIAQLVLLCTVVASYAWQRHTYPRVWTRAYGYDPQLPLRGRYLNLQVAVDGCPSTLPSARQAIFPRDVHGVIKPGPFAVQPLPAVEFSANLQVENGTLQALYISDEEQRASGQFVSAQSGGSCHAMRLSRPVDFFIADKAPALLPLKPDQELWIELTIPPKGPPRPIQLALKSDSLWQPLAYN